MAIMARRPGLGAGRLEGFRRFLVVGAGVELRLDLAPAAGRSSSVFSTSINSDQREEDRDAEGPQPLRDPQRRAQQADVGRAEQHDSSTSS